MVVYHFIEKITLASVVSTVVAILMFIRGNINEEIKDTVPILCITDKYLVVNKLVQKNDDKLIMISSIERVQIKEFNNSYLIRIKSKDLKSKYITLTNKNFEKRYYYEILDLFKELKNKL
jgi:hypothetical protein